MLFSEYDSFDIGVKNVVNYVHYNTYMYCTSVHISYVARFHYFYSHMIRTRKVAIQFRFRRLKYFVYPYVCTVQVHTFGLSNQEQGENRVPGYDMYPYNAFETPAKTKL